MSEELLDVINEQDRVIDHKPRAVIHKLGLWHRGVHVFLFTQDGKLLVQKRSADRSTAPSMLDCSVSEHVKAGEGYLDAAKRGLKEELGLESIEITPLVRFRMEYGPNDNEVSTIYKGTLTNPNVQFDPVEISEVFFMSMDEIHAGIFNYENKYCPWFVQIMKWYMGMDSKLEILEKT